jgi:hypothetical protein
LHEFFEFDVEKAPLAPTSLRKRQSRRSQPEEIEMRFMIMMNLPAGERDYPIFEWTPDAQKAHTDYHKRMNKAMRDAGEFIEVAGLTLPAQAKLVHAGKNGAPVTDGVFPETKEFLAGFWIVDVDTPERAHEIAAEASAAPGPDGKPLNMPIEVRAVMRPSGANIDH